MIMTTPARQTDNADSKTTGVTVELNLQIMFSVSCFTILERCTCSRNIFTKIYIISFFQVDAMPVNLKYV